MTVIFLGNRSGQFGTALDDFTSNVSSQRDTAYSPSSLQWNGNGGIYPAYVPKLDPVPTTICWYHWRYRQLGGSGAVNSTGSLASWYVPTGRIIFLDISGGNVVLIVTGDTTFTSATLFNVGTTATYIFDVKVEVTASLINVEFYIGGVLATSCSLANTVGGKPYPDRFVLDNDDTQGTSPAGDCSISEFIITDGNESTIGWRLHTWDNTAQGNYTQWLGDYQDIISAIDGRFIVADQVNIRESWDLSSYAGPGSPSSIRGLFHSIQADKGSTGPQNIVPFVRLGSTDYEATQFVPDPAKTQLVEWALNPATGLAWATADFTGMESGVRSAA